MASSSVKADLVIQFDATTDKTAKGDVRSKASQALNEYEELLATLHSAGFLAAGKQGNTDEEILIIVSCPWEKLMVLVEAERLAPRASE
jgi:anoctamin-10